MLDVASVSAIVASVGVLIGVGLTFLEIRHLVKQRQTDLIMRLYSRFGGEGFQRILEKGVLRGEALSFHEYEEKYGLASWVTINTFFEGIGVLLYRKLIDIRLVDDLFTAPVNMVWDKMKDGIAEARKEFGQPTIFEWFEYLYNEMKRREQQLQRGGVKNG
jgi:hypothetical protein